MNRADALYDDLSRRVHLAEQTLRAYCAAVVAKADRVNAMLLAHYGDDLGRDMIGHPDGLGAQWARDWVARLDALAARPRRPSGD